MKIYSVKELAFEKKKNHDNNSLFLNGLKGLPSKAFDEKIHSIAKQVVNQIDCTKCGNCCKHAFVGVQKSEIPKIARCLDITTDEFAEQHIHMEPDGEGGYFKTQPCPLFKDSLCSIYEERPGSCENYPGILGSHLKFRRKRILEEYGVCPIVYHTLELLKQNTGLSGS